eukprot:Gb_16631 [translate_table: standard]
MPTVKDYLRTFIRPRSYIKVGRHRKCLWIEHIDTISALAAGKKCDLLYSASWDRTVKVWSLSDFSCLESFQAHDDAINAIVVSEEGFLYTASADSKIKVWTKSIIGQRKHSLIDTLEKHKSAINALALSSDGLVLYSGGCDRVIIVWERQMTSAPDHMCAVGVLRGHMRAILCLATVSDLLCSGSADNTIRIWRREINSSQSSCLAILNGHRGPVKSITACIDDFMGCVIYSGSLDGEIRVWLDPSRRENHVGDLIL